jgi:centriolar protein POC1
MSLRFERSLSGHANWVRTAAWSPDGAAIVSGAEDSTVRVWDANTGVCTGVLYDFASPVTCVAWSPDGHTIAAGGAEGVIKLWDARAPSRSLLQHYAAHDGAGGVASIAWHPQGGAIVSTGAADGTAKIWDVAEGHALYTVRGHRAPAVNAGSFAPGGELFATAGGDGAVLVWRADLSATAGGGEGAEVAAAIKSVAIGGGSSAAAAAAALPKSPSSARPLTNSAPPGGSPAPFRAAPVTSSKTSTAVAATTAPAAQQPVTSAAILEAEPSLGMAMHYIASQLERIDVAVRALNDRMGSTERAIAELRGDDALFGARASAARSRMPAVLREPTEA